MSAGDDETRRRLRRGRDGSLHDIDERRTVPVEDLVEDIRGGRFFRAHDARTGRDCTRSVLLEVLSRALPPALNLLLDDDGRRADPFRPPPVGPRRGARAGPNSEGTRG